MMIRELKGLTNCLPFFLHTPDRQISLLSLGTFLYNDAESDATATHMTRMIVFQKAVVALTALPPSILGRSCFAPSSNYYSKAHSVFSFFLVVLIVVVFLHAQKPSSWQCHVEKAG